MNSFHLETPTPHIVELCGSDRWQIYHRLQELGIPCRCAAHKPLRIEIGDSSAAIELWCVLQNRTASRQQLIEALERCWILETR